MKLYHMAKKGLLKENQILESKSINDIRCMDNYTTSLLQEYFNKSFSRGVCVHGEHYFAKGGGFTYIHPITELLLEKGRQAIDKNLPSRANAIFAIDNLDNFNQLCSLMNINKNDYDIWEVEAENIFKADMFLIDTIQNLVIKNKSILTASMLIDYYWQGKALKEFVKNDESFWEYILEPPVKIIQKIE
ncbi:hypothetical protein ABFP60_05600 [Clostridioides difficile]